MKSHQKIVKVEEASHPDLKMAREPEPIGDDLKRARRHEKGEKRDMTIPRDVEEEILSRLPGKSVMKFRCVSKMWSSLIRSQRFMDSFFSVSSTRSQAFIICFSNNVFAKPDATRLFIFSCSHEGEQSSSVVAHLEMELPSLALSHGQSCPSVHGFLGSSHGFHYTLCNPTTRQVITLPSKGMRTVFGHDPLHNQFKALTMLPSKDHRCQAHEVTTLGGSRNVNVVTSPPYRFLTRGVCINGFVYFGAWAPTPSNPGIVCFDVRSESLSFITAPEGVLLMQGDSILIDYRGKLASIATHTPPLAPFQSFDLWILEDVHNHEWSKQTFHLPSPLVNMTSPGTNKAGDILFARKTLPHHAHPFFILYYNVERKTIRSVQIHGIADDQAFRRRYGLAGTCNVSIAPQHVQSIATL